MPILITGAAGFIGFSLASRLLRDGESVFGIDNFSPYYDVGLKHARLALLQQHKNFRFETVDIIDREAIGSLFAQEPFEAIVHLAAQVGVRYSIEQPLSYVDANLVGFGHVLEGARSQRSPHLVFASSSSVYGANRKLPFAESDNVDCPITLYGATKKANELTAFSYAHLYDLPSTGLRFFTVYGPWGRPDMALFKFTRAILAGQPIPVFNEGRMVRDFTYVDDVIEAIIRVLARPPVSGDGAATTSPAYSPPYRILNVGNGRPIELLEYIRTLESCLGRTAKLQMLPMQPGEILTTMADVSRLEQTTGFRPQVTVAEGVARFVDWYLGHYRAATAASA